MRTHNFSKLRTALLPMFLSAVLVATAAFATTANPVAASAHDEDSCHVVIVGRHADRAAMELVAWVMYDKARSHQWSGCLASPGPVALDLMEDHGADAVIIGGPAAVSKQFENSVSDLAGDLRVIDRLWGVDRLETMRAVVRFADEYGYAWGWTGEPEDALASAWNTVRIAPERSSGYVRPSGSHGGSCPGKHVDHVLPLQEAYQSGLSRSQLAEFNRWADNHRCLPASVNTSKGSSEPHEWLSKPRAGAYFRERPQLFCEFVAIWVGAKSEWRMTADREEHSAVKRILQNDCYDTDAPNLNGPADGAPTDVERGQDGGQDGPGGTCTHWHSGNPKHTHPGTDHDGTHRSGKCTGY